MMNPKIVDLRTYNNVSDTTVNEKFIIDSLRKVIECNEGKPCVIKAIVLIGKLQGMFWKAPVRKLPEEVPIDDNVGAARCIIKMAQEGRISEAQAAKWLRLIDQKSRIEERETSKRIL